MVVPAFWTNHLFSPLGTTVKQFDPARSQLAQKPFALSFKIPTFVLPDCARPCRVILPSGVKNHFEFGAGRRGSGKRLAVKKRCLYVVWSHRLPGQGSARFKD
jgi:hypothetical protein